MAAGLGAACAGDAGDGAQAVDGTRQDAQVADAKSADTKSGSPVLTANTPRAGDGGVGDGRDDGMRASDAGDAGEDLDAPVIVPDASSELGAAYATRDAAYLFDPETVRTFELYLSKRDLAVLDGDPAAEKYVPGELIFEGGLIADVGIRYKGSAGSFLGCLSGGFFPPSGAKTCVKLGMKIKIDQVDKTARFFGQKKLQFHAMNLDGSMMRERFGYGVFDEMGVHAPRSAHVRLLINGKLIGLFLLVEVVDTPFVERNFADDPKGNLYKEAWPVGNDEARYLAAIDASFSPKPSAAKMVALADALAAATDETLPGVVEHWFDMDYAARFVAIDRAIRHDDGPHHWYCGGGLGADPWHMQRIYANANCGNHNYYWYEASATERLWPIPWDLDLSNPVGTGLTEIFTAWDDLTVDCTALIPAAFGGGQMPITCDPLHRAFALTLRARVRDTLSALAAGALSEAEIDEKLVRWQALIEPMVAEAAAAYPTMPSVESWKAQVQAMRAALLEHRDEALSHLLP